MIVHVILMLGLLPLRIEKERFATYVWREDCTNSANQVRMRVKAAFSACVLSMMILGKDAYIRSMLVVHDHEVLAGSPTAGCPSCRKSFIQAWDRQRVQQRIREKTTIGEEQFGFMPGRSTTDASYVLKQTMENIGKTRMDYI